MVTLLAWTKQVKYRGLSEQTNYIWMVTKSCNIKLTSGIAWINVNNSNSSALERSFIHNWGAPAKASHANAALHTKYRRFWLCDFREEDYFNMSCLSCISYYKPMANNYDPGTGPV